MMGFPANQRGGAQDLGVLRCVAGLIADLLAI